MKEIIFTQPAFRNIHANPHLLNASNYIGDAVVEGALLGEIKGELHEVTMRELHDLDESASPEVGLLVRERVTTDDGLECWGYFP